VKTGPIVPGRLDRDTDGLPRSPEFDDRYHPRQGALAQARQVFLAGNGLPGRWRGRERFVVLETGFGLGNNFLATWQAWRDDPARPERLHFISIEGRPLPREVLAAEPRDAGLASLAAQLAAQWPPLTWNLHRLAFEAGRVQLLLALGDVAEWLPQIIAGVDAFFLDGFAPARNPQMWEPRLFKAMGRIAAPGATAATWSAARPVRDGLAAAGFEVRSEPGSGGKRDITVARFAPRFPPRPGPRQRLLLDAAATHQAERLPVAIVGGGLAGCALAWALAEAGRPAILFERHPALAQEGSGNAAGLFHGVVHGHDGHHARFHRAAAYEARRAVAEAIAGHGVKGSVNGLLRLAGGDAEPTTMQSLCDRLGLPEDYVQALSRSDASRLAGVDLAAPAWHFPGGGWVEPGGLASACAAAAGGRLELHCGRAVSSLRRSGEQWQLLDPDGDVLATAAVVVLANAGAALDLLGGGALPLQSRRGQTTGVATARWPASSALRVPLAGSGYLLPPLDGTTWLGATSDPDDSDSELRGEDHAANLRRLQGLLAEPPSREALGDLAGRVGWRWNTPDRLPLIGPLPEAGVGPQLYLGPAAQDSPRPEQPRFAPRVPGLYVFAGMGSRGIAGSALGARVLAACITGAPMPLEADLLDAIDPARFASRAFRRAGLPPRAAG
jgi:tRNA 5-methylaminomethyl-2-thiouridine biosynthesis bifunctional protein